MVVRIIIYHAILLAHIPRFILNPPASHSVLSVSNSKPPYQPERIPPAFGKSIWRLHQRSTTLAVPICLARNSSLRSRLTRWFTLEGKRPTHRRNELHAEPIKLSRWCLIHDSTPPIVLSTHIYVHLSTDLPSSSTSSCRLFLTLSS